MRKLILLLLWGAPCFAQSGFWTNSNTPANTATTDTQSVELGLKFSSSVAGNVTGLRFYKSAGNTGTHVGNLWSSTGTNLATVTFTNETASGWQTMNFASPVAITAGTVYVISYHAPQGQYSYDSNFFANPLTVGSLTATAGLYVYGTGGLPVNNYGSNYWVDVLFSTAPPPQHQAVLTWSDSVNPSGTQYNAYRSLGPSCTNFVRLNSSPINALTYTDATIVSGQSYCYEVRAINGTGESIAGDSLFLVVQ